MAAITIYGTPLTDMNMKQLRRIARESYLHFDLLTTRAELVALINDEE